jgi:transcriptional regulator with XRE-family HTH domain
MNAKDFWDRIQLLIKKNKTTQEKIAKECGISYGTFRGWIWKGICPPLLDSYNIAQALGVTVEYLLMGKDNRDKKTEAKIRKARSLLQMADKKLETMVIEDEK